MTFAGCWKAKYAFYAAGTNAISVKRSGTPKLRQPNVSGGYGLRFDKLPITGSFMRTRDIRELSRIGSREDGRKWQKTTLSGLRK